MTEDWTTGYKPDCVCIQVPLPTCERFVKLFVISSKMRKKALNHENCRGKLCIICVEKKSCRNISSTIRGLIIARHPRLNFDDPRIPNAICNNCRIGLQDRDQKTPGRNLPPPFDYEKLNVGHPTTSSPHIEELCYICNHVKRDVIALNHAVPKKSKSDEQIAAKVIREQLKEGATVQEKRYGTVTLPTGGRPLKIEVKDPNITQATASSASLSKFMKEENLSLRQMQAFEKYLRGTLGRKTVEPNAHQKIVESTHQLDEFFEADDQDFVEKDANTTHKITR